MADWKEGDNVVLEKREDYDWAPEALDHDGPASLDQITYKLVAEPSVRTAAVQSGQADVAYNPSPQELEPFKKQGFTVAAPRYLGFVNGFALNTKLAPFDDPAVRQAVQHGINRDEILSTVYTDDWFPAESFIQSNVPGATDHTEEFAYDADEAARLLDEAGWTVGDDGIRTKGGKRLELTLYPNPYLATSQAVDELVAQQLGDLGFKVKLQAFDVVTYGERVTDRQRRGAGVRDHPQLHRRRHRGGHPDRHRRRRELVQPRPERPQAHRAAATRSPARSASTSAPRVLDELQGYVLQQGYFVPLTQIVQRLYLQSPKLKGVSYNGVAYANFYTAYLEG